VATRLEREQLYGIWWYNRLRVRTRQVSEPSENGRRYRKEARFTVKPKEEWVAVPVPYSGIPREVVDAARAAIKDNRVPSKARRRFWENHGCLRCVPEAHDRQERGEEGSTPHRTPAQR